MKFTCSVNVDLPRERVIELWENPDNLHHWQDGFISMEHISGAPGAKDAESLMLYDMGHRGTMELREVIIKNDLPHEFSGRYIGTAMENTMHNWFSELSDNKTEWKAEIHYIRLSGFMVKVMVFLMPGMFRKQVQKWMDQFKAFAENAEIYDA
ncbi:MAG: SRPBCC family protein [Bacteroidota bacterium]